MPFEINRVDRIIASRYWNVNGIGIAIVAVRGHNNDVAAYIGASVEGAYKIEAAEAWAVDCGSKLSRADALSLLPTLAGAMSDLRLHYRD